MLPIILASASKGRQKVLKSLGIRFKVMPADIDERIITAPSPFLLVKQLARIKAENIAGNRQQLTDNRSYIIIAADSTAIIEEKRVKNKKIYQELVKYRLGKYLVLGKPTSKAEAFTFLTCLSDNIHQFITGLYIIEVSPKSPRSSAVTEQSGIDSKAKLMHQSITKTTIIFNRIDPEFINQYVSLQPILTYAGAYQIEKGTPGANFVRELKGSFTNVLGLPKEEIIKIIGK